MKRLMTILLLGIFLLTSCTPKAASEPGTTDISGQTEKNDTDEQSGSLKQTEETSQNGSSGGSQTVTETDTAEDAKVEEISKYNGEFINGKWTGDGISFVHDMKLGWNLGNTFDAHTDLSNRPSVDYETYWCGAKTKREMFTTLKEAGFNTVRIPVSWHNHVSGADYTIDQAWLDRVTEVADYALDEDMYVIINIHHDIYKEYLYPSSECIDNSLHYVECIWNQLAVHFADRDDHLIFESMNEPRLKDTQYEWAVSASEAGKDSCEAINRLNELFVKTVRATGGNNAERFLMIPGYCASPDGIMTSMFKMPEDTAADRLILSVHAYTPYSFALQSTSESGSTSSFKENASGGGKDIDQFLKQIYYKYVYKGIPIVIGEFGARDKNGNTDDRIRYAAYYVAKARSYDITCCWWDNNVFTGTGECFGIFNRSKLSFKYPEIVAALADNS